MKTFSSYINEALTLQYHDELNPVFWENDKLKPEIRNHLLYIAKFWQDFAKIPNSIIEDIILVGGNANYNYTEHSDLDIHFVIHKDQMEAAPEFVDEYLKDKKELWSKIHDVKVKGHDVELYAQDVNDPYQKDQGVYSLKNDDWLVHPNHVRVDYDNPHLLHKIDHLKHRIDDLISGGANEFSFKTLKDKIKNMRVAGLKKSGEFSYENLVFKELRNSGYLDRMNDHMDQMKDASLSLNEYKLSFRKPSSLGKKVAAAGLGLAATVGTFMGAKALGTSLGTSLNRTPPAQTQVAQAPTVHPRNTNPLGQVQTQVTHTPDAKPKPTTSTPSGITVPHDLITQHLGIDADTWNVYRGSLSHIESGGDYSVAGGAGKHYDGRYQLGRDAKIDAAKVLGVDDPGHHTSAREQFRANPQKQEDMLAGFTIANHRVLTKLSPQYRNLPKHKQLEVLAYSHNQGAGGGKKWLETGAVGKDAFGTSGTKYSDKLKDDLKAHMESQTTIKESHGWQEYNWKFGENRKAAKDVLKKLRKRFNLPETLPGDE